MVHLKKNITLFKGLLIAISLVIGPGIFGVAGLTLDGDNVRNSAMGWFVTITCMMPMIYIFSQLGLKFSSSDGICLYIQKAAGKWGAFVVAVLLLGTLIFSVPALCYIGGAYLAQIFELSSPYVTLLSFAILSFVTGLNLLGVRFICLPSLFSLLGVFAVLSLIITANAPCLVEGMNIFWSGFATVHELDFFEVRKVAMTLIFAFIGWESLSFGLEEFRNPQKTIPRVYWISFLCVAALYLAIALSVIGAHSLGYEVRNVSGLLSLVMGSPVAPIVSGLIILIIAANVSSWIFAFSRLVFASARKGILPQSLTKLSSSGVPTFSILVLFVGCSAVIAVSALLKLSASYFILMTGQNFMLLYIFCTLAYARTESDWKRWPITILAVSSCGFFLSGFTWLLFYPALLILLGSWIYGMSEKRRKRDLEVQSGTEYIRDRVGKIAKKISQDKTPEFSIGFGEGDRSNSKWQ